MSALGNEVRKVCDEWVLDNGLGPTSDWHVTRLLPLAERIDEALACGSSTPEQPAAREGVTEDEVATAMRITRVGQECRAQCGLCMWDGPWRRASESATRDAHAHGCFALRRVAEQVSTPEQPHPLSNFSEEALIALNDLVEPLEEMPQSDRFLQLIAKALEVKRLGGAAGPASVGRRPPSPSNDNSQGLQRW
jgi:hypothetical protein